MVIAPATRRLKLNSPGEKLLTPLCYDCMVDWVQPKVAHVLLKNKDTFWVDMEESKRFHGGCCVVKNSLFSENIGHPQGYNDDAEDTTTEREMRRIDIKVNDELGRPIMKRYDTYGTVWTRRRYTLKDDEQYSCIQWMDTKSLKLKEKPMTTKLEDVAANISSALLSIKALEKDVAEMRTMLKNYTTLVDASLAVAQALKEVVTDQSNAHASLCDQVTKLRSEIRET